MLNSRGGESEIRTHDTVSRMAHFKCAALILSAISPYILILSTWRKREDSNLR